MTQSEAVSREEPTLSDAVPSPASKTYSLPAQTLADLQSKAEQKLAPFSSEFRKFWDVVSDKDATPETVDACLRGAYRLGVTRPEFRPWLPLSKVGETLALLHIMRCNMCLEQQRLEEALFDGAAAVRLTRVPGSPTCSPRVSSPSWFAQACRALGRTCVKLGNSMRASECLAHAINALKEEGKADSAAIDVLLWRVMGHCWPLPDDPHFGPIDCDLARLESPSSDRSGAGEPTKTMTGTCHSGLARNFCTVDRWTLPDHILNVYSFSGVQCEHSAVLFGGMYAVPSSSAASGKAPGKPSCINSVIRIDMSAPHGTPFGTEYIKTIGEEEAPKRPHPRFGHCAVVHQKSMYVVFGQGDAATKPKDAAKCSSRWGQILWRLDMDAWRWHRVHPSGTLPPARYDANAVQHGGIMYVYGGRPCVEGSAAPGEPAFGDMWALDLQSYAWTQLATQPELPSYCSDAQLAEPHPRHSACMWVWDGSIFLFGGAAHVDDGTRHFGDLWRFSIKDRCWTELPLLGNPPAARSEAMLAHGDTHVFVVGGYSTAAMCALPEATNGPLPTAQQSPDARRTMYLCTYMHDAFELDKASLTWRQLRRSDRLPILTSGRSAGASYLLPDDRLVVLGGHLGMMKEQLMPGDGNLVHWRKCQACGASAGKGGDALLECQGCAKAGGSPAFYCCEDCQRYDWEVHKGWCSGSHQVPIAQC